MSITRSYNKHTGISYAYETSYVWDDERKKKVQKKKCIGQFDEKTGEVVPNQNRGRPRKEASAQVINKEEKPCLQTCNSEAITKTMKDISLRITEIEKTFHSLESEVAALGKDLVLLKEQTAR